MQFKLAELSTTETAFSGQLLLRNIFIYDKAGCQNYRDRYRIVLNQPLAPRPCPARPAARYQTALHRRPTLSAAPNAISSSRPVTARCGTVVLHPAASAGRLIMLPLK